MIQKGLVIKTSEPPSPFPSYTGFQANGEICHSHGILFYLFKSQGGHPVFVKGLSGLIFLYVLLWAPHCLQYNRGLFLDKPDLWKTRLHKLRFVANFVHPKFHYFVRFRSETERAHAQTKILDVNESVFRITVSGNNKW